MKVRVNMLWKVPVFCLCAGFASFWLTVLLVSNFGVTTLPDGRLTSNTTFTTLLDLFIFAGALGIGYFIFRKMTKKEIFWSSTIIVVILLLLLLFQLIVLDTDIGLANSVGIWSMYATQWCRIISLICYYIININNSWASAFICCMTPYIFVLFGKNSE